MEINSVIESLRVRKNVSVKDLCEGIITKSTYSRFVNGHAMIKADSLLQIVSRLNMTFAMFLQDYVDFFKLKHDYTALYHAIVFDDLDLITDLIDDYSNVDYDNKNEIIFLKTAFIMKSHSEGHLIESKVLQQSQSYFEHLDYWTDYDYKSFKHLAELYDTDYVLKIVNSIITLINDLTDPSLQEEVFYILAQTFTRLLKEHQWEQASSIFHSFKQLFVDEHNIGKNIYYTSVKALAEMIYHHNLDYVEEYEGMIEFYSYLKMDSRVDELIDIYESIQVTFDLPTLSFNNGGA